MKTIFIQLIATIIIFFITRIVADNVVDADIYTVAWTGGCLCGAVNFGISQIIKKTKSLD